MEQQMILVDKNGFAKDHDESFPELSPPIRIRVRFFDRLSVDSLKASEPTSVSCETVTFKLQGIVRLSRKTIVYYEEQNREQG